jgi:hypothetical protein
MALHMGPGKAARGVAGDEARPREIRLFVNCAASGDSFLSCGVELLSSVLAMTPRAVVWWTMNEQLQPEKLKLGRSLRALVERAAIDWVDGKPGDGPTHRLEHRSV